MIRVEGERILKDPVGISIYWMSGQRSGSDEEVTRKRPGGRTQGVD